MTVRTVREAGERGQAVVRASATGLREKAFPQTGSTPRDLTTAKDVFPRTGMTATPTADSAADTRETRSVSTKTAKATRMTTAGLRARNMAMDAKTAIRTTTVRNAAPTRDISADHHTANGRREAAMATDRNAARRSTAKGTTRTDRTETVTTKADRTSAAETATEEATTGTTINSRGTAARSTVSATTATTLTANTRRKSR